jgi:serine protease AprX
LMLTQDPTLTPDEVKCRLMDSAHTAFDNNGELAYSVFQQGSGVVNVADALASKASACANQALDIAQDIAGNEHFSGPANIDSDGNFYIEGLGEDYVWKLNEGTVDGSAVLWKVNYGSDNQFWKNTASTDAVLWKVDFETDAVLWKVNLESDAVLWKVNWDGTDHTTIDVNLWVEQQ